MPDILFINTTDELAINQEVNGTLLLATKLLADGFDAQILRFCQIEGFSHDYERFIANAVAKILSLQPKCVSFYTLWPQYHIILRIARELRAKDSGILLILGGPQSSATAQATMEAMPFIDYICTGEGEYTVVPFFRALLRGEGDLADVPGLYRRQGGQVRFNATQTPLCDLETLPYWDDRLYADVYQEDPQKLSSPSYFLPIDAGRGCPYNCSFCCTSYFWRRTYRLKSPERIVADIRYFYNKFGIRSFWFAHDAFTVNRALVEEVCDRIIDEGLDIRWNCSSRVDCLSEELILKMKRSGLAEICLGIETGSARMQKLIHKNLDLNRTKQIIECLLREKIVISLNFMLGFPDETEADLNDTLTMAFSLLDMGAQDVEMFYCRFNPATEITEQHRDELVLDPSIKILSRAIYGYAEELPTIAAHRDLFPFFYHLHTPVRDEFQYMIYLLYIHQQFPKTARHIRALYRGDYLKMYRDMVRNNPIFNEEIGAIQKYVMADPLRVLCDSIRDLDVPYLPQLCARLKLERDGRRVEKSPEDITIHDTYDLNFVDYSLKRPMEAYGPGRTELIMQKTGGVTELKVLKIEV